MVLWAIPCYLVMNLKDRAGDALPSPARFCEAIPSVVRKGLPGALHHDKHLEDRRGNGASHPPFHGPPSPSLYSNLGREGASQSPPS